MSSRTISSRSCWFAAAVLFVVACSATVAGLFFGDVTRALWIGLPILWASAMFGAVGLVLLPPRLAGATTGARSLAVTAAVLVPLGVLGLPVVLAMLLLSF